MALIKSISGIRGTIGGKAGEGLNPLDIVKFTSAYATLIRRTTKVDSNKIVVGRDARISGEMVKNVVCGTLMGMGFDVVNIGLASTPTTEVAVTMEGACGGIIITASHNPRHWNALKLLNEKGEFLNAAEGQEVLRIAEAEDFDFADVDTLGKYTEDNTYDQKHIDMVLGLDLVDVEAIRKANFRVAFDAVNSVGGVVLPKLLEQLGVKTVTPLFAEPTGDFQHNPEPLEKNLGDIMALMAKGEHDVAFVVDPDVDRLAFICEDGKMYGEEYTLVTVADYVLKHTPGNTVSNLSSTRALRDVTAKYGMEYNAAAVGEVNVVTKMKETNTVIGGEGNGGVIYPAAHYGQPRCVRDGRGQPLLGGAPGLRRDRSHGQARLHSHRYQGLLQRTGHYLGRALQQHWRRGLRLSAFHGRQPAGHARHRLDERRVGRGAFACRCGCELAHQPRVRFPLVHPHRHVIAGHP